MNELSVAIRLAREAGDILRRGICNQAKHDRDPKRASNADDERLHCLGAEREVRTNNDLAFIIFCFIFTSRSIRVRTVIYHLFPFYIISYRVFMVDSLYWAIY